MKKIYVCVVLLVIVLFNSCKDNYKRSLSDFNNYSDFVALSVSNGTDSMKIVIENAQLYSILNDNVSSLSERKYMDDAYVAIINDKPLLIDNKSYSSLCSYELKFDEEIGNLNKKGIDTLLNTYFEGKVLYKALADTKERHLIYCLYNNKILVRTDCESGYLYIND